MSHAGKYGFVVPTRAPLIGAAALLAALVWLPAAQAAKETEPSSVASEAELAGQELPAPVFASLREALDAYEEIRSELAADELAGLPASASRLRSALGDALGGREPIAEETTSVIEEAAFIVESLPEATELARARASFAELSRRFLLLAEADPRLAEGLQVFSCPMVETFDKWMQPGETIENPYMGQEMLTCGTSTDWSVKPAESWLASASARETVPGEPVFEPGIAGIKMEDVRDYKFLWREIAELQKWERGERITITEYRDKVIEKTAHFLEFEGAEADEFTEGAAEAIAAVRNAFHQHQHPGAEHVGASSSFSKDLQVAADQMGAFLDGQPRHQLFAPETKKWLLKLAFGPREDKEKREAREVKRL